VGRRAQAIHDVAEMQALHHSQPRTSQSQLPAAEAIENNAAAEKKARGDAFEKKQQN
jgi:hypothetical protein